MDCLEGMKQLDDESVDSVITDPPYNVGIDYGNGKEKDDRPNYSEWLNNVWIEAGRVAKEGGFLIYTNTTAFIPHGMSPPTPWRFFHLACWNKPLSLRPSWYGICPHWEPIFICLKGEVPWRSFRGKDVFSDVINANVEFGNKDTHPTIKPVSLYEKLILFGCPENGLVLDPFMGSGTTAVAARKLNRNFIGFEINPAYCEIAEKRLANIPQRLEEFLK